MSDKEKTTIYLDKTVKRKAEDLGLNLSKVAENALKTMIAAMEAAKGSPASGFEPGREAPQTEKRANKDYRPVEPNAGVQIPSPAPQSSSGPSRAVPFLAVSQPYRLPGVSREDLLGQFKRFLEVDLQREKLTVNGHGFHIAQFLGWLGPRDVTTDVLRDYLDQYRSKDADTYANQLKSLKVFFRDFLSQPGLVASFRFPRKGVELKVIPHRGKLQRFFKAVRSLDTRAAVLFLLWATSGWRRREVMALHREDVDLDARIMTHRVKSTSTKGRLIGLFNEETQTLLRAYLAARTDDNPKLVPISEKTFRVLWHQAGEACGFLIQPQLLRDWFCEAMGNRKVPDRYIDAFCGRVPKSVLARHYTDYAPEKLKRIYDRARLRVLADG